MELSGFTWFALGLGSGSVVGTCIRMLINWKSGRDMRAGKEYWDALPGGGQVELKGKSEAFRQGVQLAEIEAVSLMAFESAKKSEQMIRAAGEAMKDAVQEVIVAELMRANVDCNKQHDQVLVGNEWVDGDLDRVHPQAVEVRQGVADCARRIHGAMKSAASTIRDRVVEEKMSPGTD